MTLTAPPVRPTISQTFESLRAARRIAFMPFIPAGYPNLQTTAALLPALESAGANLIEVGFPFSDPIADGSTIQEAYNVALANKVRVADVFALVADARARVSVPLVGMISYSLIYRYGLDRFLAAAKAAGFDGLIIPDLPPPEGQGVCEKVRAAGLDTILLVAPTTTPERRAEIARLSSGFIYYLSVSGITGERADLPPELAGGVRNLKSLTDRPVCVGFGISTSEHVTSLVGVADGAIVGSAIVKRMKQHANDPTAVIVASVASYCRDLLRRAR